MIILVQHCTACSMKTPQKNHFLYLILLTYYSFTTSSPSLSDSSLRLALRERSREQGGLCRLLSGFGFVSNSGLSANAQVQLIGIIKPVASSTQI